MTRTLTPALRHWLLLAIAAIAGGTLIVLSGQVAMADMDARQHTNSATGQHINLNVKEHIARNLIVGRSVAVLLTRVTAAESPDDLGIDGGTAIIELRVWQHLDDETELWVSATAQGGAWDTLGTIPLLLDGREGGFDAGSLYRFGNIGIDGVGLRVYQRVVAPELIYVSGCVGACPEWVYGAQPDWTWRPLGKTLLPLDDGIEPFGEYRYGDIRIAVPRTNLGLLADREHLLALRDVLEGGEAELNWNVGTTTAEWEGITVAGTPPRATGLALPNRGLAGEIWGWVGNLTELTELRLDGNALTGIIPSKLRQLTNLSQLYLSANELDGCVPALLHAVPENDLAALGIPDCPEPPPYARPYTVNNLLDSPPDPLPAGTYHVLFSYQFNSAAAFVFDVIGDSSVQVERWNWYDDQNGIEPARSIFEDGAALGYALRNGGNADTWLFLEDGAIIRALDAERSPYSGCIYDCAGELSMAAWIERLAASLWIHTAVDYDHTLGWVWRTP